MSALIGNPLLLTSAPAADDDSYKIEKSLRFNSADTPRLDRTPSTKGNRRKWTYSCWFKFGKLPSAVTYGQVLFAGGESDQNQVRIGFEGANYDTGRLQVLGNNSNSSIFKLETNALFKDPGAWYHICVAFDSTDDTSGDRVKIFINGKRVTSFADETYPSQNVETHVTNTKPHTLGCMQLNTTPTYVWEFDGYLADVQFIDGLALSPLSFGEFDSTGVFNPKAFSPRLPNNGTTWSGGTKSGNVANASGSTGWVQGFDGDTSTLVYASDNNGLSTIELGGDGGIPFTKLEMYVGKHGTAGTHVYVNDKIVSDDVTWALNGDWKDITEYVTSPLKKFGLKNVGGGSSNLRAIRIDGHILIDGANQGVDGTRTNPNNDTTWSAGTESGQALTNGGGGSQGWDKHMDGNIANPTMHTSSSATHYTYTNKLPAGIYRINAALSSGGSATHILTGDDDTEYTFGTSGTDGIIKTGANNWSTAVNIPQEVKKVTLIDPSNGNGTSLRAIEVDGHVLIDDTVDNSFHLKFNDISSNSALGKDSLNSNDFTVNNLTTATRSYSDNNQLLPDSDSDQTGVPSTGANASGAFDGNANTNFAVERKDGTGTGNVGGVWTPSPKITGVTSLHFSGFQQSNTDIRVNEGSWTAMSGLTGYSAGSNTAWLTCDSLITNSEITKIEFRRTSISPNYGTNMAGIKINGTQLVNIGTKDIDTSTDSPTNYGTDRGNFCTWNPLMIGDSTTQSFTQGNLEWKNDGADAWTGGTLGVKAGSSTTDKWYWEIEVKHGKGGYGICNYNNKDNDHTDWGGGTDRARIYLSSNGKLSNPAGGADLTYGSNTTCVVGDIIGVALDLSPGGTSGKITFYKNGTSLGVAHTDIDTSRYWTIFANDYGENPVGGVLNTGQRPFKYTAPTDHKCLCTTNFINLFDSEDSENNPSKYFDILTYKGTGAVNTVRGLNFQPDLIWIKNRGTSSTSHSIYDAARGQGSNGYLRIESDDDDGQVDQSNLTAINSDGFTLTSAGNYTNGTNANHIAWCWDAGTAAATASTDGSITPSAQWVNATAGFSISQYTGTGADATIGHGLGAKPDFMMFKELSDPSNDSWAVYHKDLTNIEKWLALNTNDAEQTYADEWNETHPTNTVAHIGAGGRKNENGNANIMYCWTPIPGYSAFGSYRGNSSTSGHFIYTGFRPKWLLRKRYVTHSGTDYAESWILQDSAREPNNPLQLTLYPNLDNAEQDSYYDVDFLSNGFNMLDNSHSTNNSSASFVYAAFAEYPFKTTRAK